MSQPSGALRFDRAHICGFQLGFTPVIRTPFFESLLRIFPFFLILCSVVIDLVLPVLRSNLPLSLPAVRLSGCGAGM